MAEITAEEHLNRYDQLRQHYQTIATQVVQIRQLINETNKTFDELSALKGDERIYKELGSVMIEVHDSEKLKSDLEDKKESLEFQLKRFVSQEESIKEQLKEIQNQLETILNKGNQ